MKKIIVFSVFALGLMVFNISQRVKSNDAGFNLIQSIKMNISQAEEVDYSVGYINDFLPCKVTETRYCSIPICYGAWCCTVGFSYTVKLDGTMNPCKFTAGPSGCTFFLCKKNE